MQQVLAAEDHPAERGSSRLGFALKLTSMLVLPVLLLALIAGGVGYFRLLRGPVPLQFLVNPVERGINAEIGALRSSIDTVVVMLTEAGGIEFRLVGLRVLEPDGDVALSAPQAAMELSWPALWALQATPSRIELIEPRLSLVYSDQGGLSLRFDRRGAGTAPGGGSGPVGSSPQGSGPSREGAGTTKSAVAGEPGGIDLATLLAPGASGTPSASGARTHLKEFGLRDAVVSLDAGGRRTTWQVPRLSVDLDERDGGSILSGAARLSTAGRIWTVSFRTEHVKQAGHLLVTAAIRDLMPRTLGDVMPQLALLRTIDFPVSGDARLELGEDGRIISTTLDLALSGGRLLLPDVAAAPLSIDAGLVHLAYDAADGVVRLAPSTLRWGDSSLTLAGRLTPLASATAAGRTAIEATGAGAGAALWRYEIAAEQGALSIAEFGVPPMPLDVWRASGTVEPERGRLVIDDLHVSAGGGDVRFAGEIETSSAEPSVRLEGKLGAMPAVAFKALWPRAVVPWARQWVGQNIRDGRISGGTMQLLTGRHLDGAGPQSISTEPFRLALAVTAEDIIAEPVPGLPPIHIPRALISHGPSGIEVVMPVASSTLRGGERIDLKTGRFSVHQRADGESDGEVSFTANAKAAAALHLLGEPFFERLGRIDLDADKVSGAVTADVALVFPLAADVSASDVKLSAKARLTDGTMRGVLAGVDIKGAAIDFELTDRAVDAKGNVLIEGVAAKIAGQRIFKAPPDAQPPLRITAVLDSADRRQLGMDLADALQGDVPVEVTIAPQAGGEPRIRLRAELNNADLAIEGLAWRKPPGRTAYLEGAVAKASNGRLMISDLRIAGDDIAIEGSMLLDADHRVQEFAFPRFSLNLVTRLAVTGRRDRDGVWKLDVKGPTFEGKELFRSLFSVDQPGDGATTAAKAGAGIDVSAQIDNVLGFSEVSLRTVKVALSRRQQEITALDLKGTLDGGGSLDAQLVRDRNGRRQLVATATDAGQAFKLVDFYSNLSGGRMRLDINLDAGGAADTTGVLVVDNFRVLGDPVVSEVAGTLDESSPAIDGKRNVKKRMVRQVFDFDRLRAPFSRGHGQFVIEEAYVRGPLLGATLRGKADFARRRIDLGGTYVPLQGLNNAFGPIPLLGELLSGPRKEGIFGVTFAVQGAMDQPQVLVNPLSIVAPGIFREIFQMTPQDPSVQPRGEGSGAGSAIPAAARASSSPPTVSSGSAARKPATEGWSSETKRP